MSSKQRTEKLKNDLIRISKTLGSKHLAVADAWVTLALHLYDSGQLHEAEASCKKALKVRLLNLDRCDESICHVHFYLGRIYFEMNDFALAKKHYQESIELYEDALRPEDAFLATVLDSLAKLYHDRDKYKEAESLILRSLFIRLCVLEAQDPAIAESLNHLGWLYCQKGRYKKAENLFLSALDIWMSTLGPEHSSTALCLENYAYVLNKTGRVKQANDLLVKVDSIRSLQP